MFSTISSFITILQPKSKKSYNYDEILKIIEYKSYKYKNNFINYIINKIEKTNKDIITFNKKKKLFIKLNNYKKCLVCKKDDILHIILDSGNEICIDCFHPNIKS